MRQHKIYNDHYQKQGKEQQHRITLPFTDHKVGFCISDKLCQPIEYLEQI
jgi:hypothetical protein